MRAQWGERAGPNCLSPDLFQTSKISHHVRNEQVQPSQTAAALVRNAFLPLANLKDSMTSCAIASRNKKTKKQSKGAAASDSTTTSSETQSTTKPGGAEPGSTKAAGPNIKAEAGADAKAPSPFPAQDHTINKAAGPNIKAEAGADAKAPSPFPAQDHTIDKAAGKDKASIPQQVGKKKPSTVKIAAKTGAALQVTALGFRDQRAAMPCR